MRFACALAVVAVLALLYVFRYEYHSGPLGVPLRTNRFTGQVEKFWSEPEKDQPLGWYQIPMGEADRALRQAAQEEQDRQAQAARIRQEEEERAQWFRDREFERLNGVSRREYGLPPGVSPGFHPMSGPPLSRPVQPIPPRHIRSAPQPPGKWEQGEDLPWMPPASIHPPRAPR